jgi:hypothetical protein
MMICTQPRLSFVSRLFFANAAAKFEIRISKSETNSKIERSIMQRRRLRLLNFERSDLFRISKFGFRIFLKQGMLLTLALIWCGCAGPRYVAGPRIDDARRTRVCAAALDAAYPAEFNASLRLVLAVRGRRYDFTGYLRMARAGRLHLVAYGDFGGAVFEVTADAAGAAVVSKPRGMPAKLLTDGIARDLQHVFGKREVERARLVAREDGAAGLTLECDAGAAAEYVFAAGDGRLLRSLAARRGRITREAEYDPPRIVIRNHRAGYTLELEVLKLTASQPHER